jgi:arylsulfatase
LLKGYEAASKKFKVHLDGYNQLDMLTGKGPSKRHEFFYFAETEMTAIRVNNWKVHLAVKEEWLEAAKKMPGGVLIDLKIDPFERSPESEGWFLWMKEKSWALPEFAGPTKEFAKSLEQFPPRQKGAGIGAATITGKVARAGGPTD